MFCSKCGEKLNEGERFCHKCGQATTASGGSNEHLKTYAAIAFNAVVVVMFFLPWFSVIGMGLLTDKSGVTLFNAFSVVSDASKMIGGDNSLLFIQVVLALLFAVPLLNFLSGIMLFIKSGKARLVSKVAAAVTFGLTAVIVVAIFIMNSHISNKTDGLIPSLLTVQVPAYIVVVLGLVGIFLVGHNKEVSMISGEMEERRTRVTGSATKNVLVFVPSVLLVVAIAVIIGMANNQSPSTVPITASQSDVIINGITAAQVNELTGQSFEEDTDSAVLFNAVKAWYEEKQGSDFTFHYKSDLFGDITVASNGALENVMTDAYNLGVTIGSEDAAEAYKNTFEGFRFVVGSQEYWITDNETFATAYNALIENMTSEINGSDFSGMTNEEIKAYIVDYFQNFKR